MCCRSAWATFPRSLPQHPRRRIHERPLPIKCRPQPTSLQELASRHAGERPAPRVVCRQLPGSPRCQPAQPLRSFARLFRPGSLRVDPRRRCASGGARPRCVAPAACLLVAAPSLGAQTIPDRHYRARRVTMPMQRPLSPFMFPTWYRFQITSALSILHRLTGIALAIGSILLAWWLVAVAAGGDIFAATHAFLASPIGLLLLLAWSAAFFYHLCSGVRHLAWDAGRGFELRSANRSGHAVLAATVVLTILAWLTVWLI